MSWQPGRQRSSRWALLGFYFDFVPGATYVVSHHVREPCRLAKLWIANPQRIELERATVEPHRDVPLGEPRVVEHSITESEAFKDWAAILGWPVLGNCIVPAHAAIQLYVRSLHPEPFRFQAGMWVELL